jgi:hypothetical protein
MALFPLGILSAAGAGGVAGDYELIETQILGSAQASVVFSSLGTYSSTYKHLQIRVVARAAAAVSNESLRVRLNGDSGSNYSFHQLFGNGSSVGSSGSTSQTGASVILVAGDNDASSIFGAGVVDILDAYSTTKNKTLRGFSGNMPGAGLVLLRSSAYLSTSSTTSITLTSETAANLMTGSRFSLYGIKG